VVRVLDSGAGGPGFKSQPQRCLRQTVHTYCASVHQAAKLVAALLWVARVSAGLAESNGSLPPGLWLASPAGWLPRTGISSGTLRSIGNWVWATFIHRRIVLSWLHSYNAAVISRFLMQIKLYYINFIFVVQLQFVNIVIKRICYVLFNMLRVCTFGWVTETVIVASDRSFCINKAHTHTTVLLPLQRSACASRPVKNWTILLVQSFTARMPLLTAISAFGLITIIIHVY